LYRYSPEQMKLAKEEHATEMKKRQEKYGGAGKDEVDMGLDGQGGVAKIVHQR
jgi:hypothetical protein